MTTRRLISAALLIAALGVGRAAQAQTGGVYNLTWNTLDGGGATFATGGAHALGGTIGQADAGTSTGSAYTLAGGFWAGVSTGGAVYLPLLVR